jgi:hypothetical protein
VISVAMLSEGWDAKNVTHIMGLRAFTSQLLCEQVIGRGLRRVTYDTDENGLFRPEYVNVFGVPLSIYEPAEGGEAPPPPKPSTQIDVIPERAEFELRWPNVLRIETVVKPVLTVDWNARSTSLTLDPAATAISAELAPALGGATDMSKVRNIDLASLPEGFRLQRLTFVAARKAFSTLKGSFRGNEEYLLLQLIRLVETFLASGKVDIPSLFHTDPIRRRVLIALNIDNVVQHLMRFVTSQNTTELTPVFDEENPIGSTGQMRPWYTTKPNFPTVKSHISHVVGDSAWEGYAANVFETRDEVVSFAKNDHLGFQIHYLWQGSRRRYVPDFIVRLRNGVTLALEIKGVDSPQNKAKRDALAEWVSAVNAAGGFGTWAWDVAFEAAHVHDIVSKHDRLVGVKNAFVATSEKVTFHPKLYYFQSGDTAEAIVGSSNFTNGGLDRNHEANLHVKGPSNSKVFADIRAQIEKYRPIQRPVTKELAESYRLQHNAARLLPKPRNPSLPGTSAFAAQLASPLARLDWEAYVKAVKSSPYHNFKARLGLLRECQRMFASVSSFADLSNSEWKAIAGVIGEKQKQEAKLAQHDWGWFGSMKGMGDFANRIAEKDEAIANALDAIPRHGEVSEANYDQFRKEFLRAFKNSSRVGGVPTATRLLAMKRPDTFVCISKPNKAGLAEALGFPKTALELDNYWQRVIEPVRMPPPLVPPRPRTYAGGRSAAFR